MRTRHVGTLAVAVLFLSTGSSRAGLMTITPAMSTITLGQTVLITIGADSSLANNGFLVDFGLQFTLTGGPIPPNIPQTVKAAAGLPGAFTFEIIQADGSAAIFDGHSTITSFDGPVYTFEFTPAAVGLYTFTDNNSTAGYSSGAKDSLTGSDATVNVLPTVTTAPEPGSLTLLGWGVAGVALAFRRRTTA
jgi:hypothetical protein